MVTAFAWFHGNYAYMTAVLKLLANFVKNKINLKTPAEIIALLYLCKCVPGRTKTGVVPWRCRDVKTKHSVTRPTQEIRPTELCSLID